MEKLCNKCHHTKPIDQFYTRGRSKGYSAYCKPCVKERNREIQARDVEQIKSYQQQYQQENKQRIASQIRGYYLQNKEQITQWRLAYNREKRKTDPMYRLRSCLRFSIVRALRGLRKDKKTEKILGCSFEEARQHIENQFKDGMTWENRGLYGWHVDHIIPLSSAQTVEEAEKLCHYTNLQPLWAIDNLKKGARYNGEQVES